MSESPFKQCVEPPPHDEKQTDAQQQTGCFAGMQKITDGKSDAFYAIPGIHGNPGETVIAGDGSHGKSGTGDDQNDERNDKKQNIDFFHVYDVRFVGLKFIFDIKQRKYVKQVLTYFPVLLQ